MVAALVLRPRKAVAAVVAALLILGFIIAKPIDIPLPKVDLPYVSRSKSSVTASGTGADRIAETVAAASNSTLGFSRIVLINLKNRWDRADAAAIQSYVSGLDVEVDPAVDAKADIENQGHIGLPPTSGEVLPTGQIACWRSHANIWTEMVRTRSPPVLIMEADASWDVNLRSIMGSFNQRFLEFLVHTRAKPTDSPPHEAQALPNRPKGRPVEHTPDDPWQSEFWDIISIGHCHVDRLFPGFNGPQTTYQDEFFADQPEQWKAYDIPKGVNRVIRRSESFVCATGYALSHRGAAKLLLRSAMNLDLAVDILMRKMITDGELISYTLSPPPVVQWAYRDAIGMNLGHNSDIHRADDAPENAEKPDLSGFEQAEKDHSIWIPNKYDDLKFDKPALEAWSTIFSPEAQFTMPKASGSRGQPVVVEASMTNSSASARSRIRGR